MYFYIELFDILKIVWYFEKVGVTMLASLFLIYLYLFICILLDLVFIKSNSINFEEVYSLTLKILWLIIHCFVIFEVKLQFVIAKGKWNGPHIPRICDQKGSNALIWCCTANQMLHCTALRKTCYFCFFLFIVIW